MVTSANNKCKAFTSLEQSRKLAEILPLESADMCCFREQNGSISYYEFPFSQANKASNPIPCWSLASLLDVIPQEIFDGEYVINITEGCDNRWVLTYDHCENRNHSYYGLSTGADNLIDACYELILKLNELNLL